MPAVQQRGCYPRPVERTKFLPAGYGAASQTEKPRPPPSHPPPRCGPTALTAPQVFGNALACALIWAGWGGRYRDLGPLRLVERGALGRMRMRDRGFGWTVEMQVRWAIDLRAPGSIKCGMAAPAQQKPQTNTLIPTPYS